MSLKVVAGTPGLDVRRGKADTTVGSRGSAGASLAWKVGVLVMCLGVRSPSGGEARRQEGVIHKTQTRRARL